MCNTVILQTLSCRHSVLNLNQDFQIPFPQMEAQRPRTIQITRIGKTRDGLTLGNDSSDDED